MQLHTVRDVGATVRDARVRQGLTQAELARRAGVSREWLVRLEHGSPRLEMQLVLDTLAAVGLTLAAVESDPADTPHEARWNEVLTGLADRRARPVGNQSSAAHQHEETDKNG
jgi:y4mF family transcriptional regulator